MKIGRLTFIAKRTAAFASFGLTVRFALTSFAIFYLSSNSCELVTMLLLQRIQAELSISFFVVFLRLCFCPTKFVNVTAEKNQLNRCLFGKNFDIFGCNIVWTVNKLVQSQYQLIWKTIYGIWKVYFVRFEIGFCFKIFQASFCQAHTSGPVVSRINPPKSVPVLERFLGVANPHFFKNFFSYFQFLIHRL